METVELVVEPRNDCGKGAARRLRAAGRIPAVLYGPNRPATHISVETAEFERKVAALEGAHLLRLRGQHGAPEAVVLLKEMQEHPLTGRILHADFVEVDLTKRLEVTVPLHFVGRAVGVVAGGILQPVIRELEVECPATSIPEAIEIDVSGLDIHDSIHVKDVPLPPDVRCLMEPALTVVTVAAPAVEAEAAAEVPGEVSEGEPAASESAPSESNDE